MDVGNYVTVTCRILHIEMQIIQRDNKPSRDESLGEDKDNDMEIAERRPVEGWWVNR